MQPRDFLSNDNQTENTQIENPQPRDFLQDIKNQPESFSQSAIMAPNRILEDILHTTYNTVKNIPSYYQKSKSQIPAAFNTIIHNPSHAASQLGAGITEMGHNVLNAPHDISEYATNRLHIMSPETLSKIPYQKDISGDINNVFGEPNKNGDEFLRGLAEHSAGIVGGVELSKILNPMNLTSKNIAKDVLKTEKEQINKHSDQYNKIWDKAGKTGYDMVPIDQQKLSDYLSSIEKYKTPREYQSLEDLILNPTLENAQKAQSDMGIISRSLSDKSRAGSLTSEERNTYQAAKEAENHIESNMFKDSLGNTNSSLKKQYDKVTKSYRKNVVPYKYNTAIQAYKNQEMLPKELVSSLSRGEFAAKKGSSHPELKIRELLTPSWNKVGVTGILGLLLNNMIDNGGIKNTQKSY